MANDTRQKHAGGRPPLSDGDKNEMLRKLEPYLKSGLSLRKSIIEAGIASTTFYKYKNEDESFRSKIERDKQYLSVILNSSIVKELHEVIKRQNGYKDTNGNIIPPAPLSKKDIKFLQWFATTSNLTKEEYGDRTAVELYDPESALHNITDTIEEEVKKAWQKYN